MAPPLSGHLPEPCRLCLPVVEAHGSQSEGSFRAVLALQVLLSPGTECLNQWDQAAAVGAEAISHLRRFCRHHLPLHQPAAFQVAQVLGQHLVADLRDRAAKISIALRVLPQLPEDRQGPLALQHLEGSSHEGGAFDGISPRRQGCAHSRWRVWPVNAPEGKSFLSQAGRHRLPIDLLRP